MREILNKYKDRLINLSGKNRSLVIKKIYKKRAFDIYNLKEFNDDIYSDILNYVNDNKILRCEIIKDCYKFFSNEKQLLDSKYEDQLKKLREKFESIECLEENKVYIDKKLNIDKKYKEDLDKLEKKRDRLIEYKSSIKDLNKEITAVEKETGKRELYLAYPFIEGYFKDGTFFKAPLMLYPVSLINDKDKWVLTNESENKIIINKVFLLAIEKYNEIKVTGIEEEYDEITNSVIKDIIEKINEFGIELELNFNGIEKFKENTAKDTPKYNWGTGRVLGNILIGQFTLANSTYNDYMELINSDVNNRLLKALLKTNMSENSDGEFIEENGKLSFSENELYLTSQLDYSQELAVKKANDTDKLVIYGAPGTGKSQTITNIISDGLAKGKKILMVSQKRAALDVIYNRLGELNSKAVIIHDVNRDKKEFYKLLATELENSICKCEESFCEIIENGEIIDEKIMKLERLAEVLFTKREIGLNLQEMYSKTKLQENCDNKLNKFIRYRKLSEEDNFNKIPYDKLSLEIRKIDTEIINSFLKFNDLYEENRLINNINLNINNIDVLESKLGLESALKNIESINTIKNDDMNIYVEIIGYLKNHKDTLNESNIEKIAAKINQKENGNLKIKLNSGNWWEIDNNRKDCCSVINNYLEKNNYDFERNDIISLAIEFNENKNGYLKNKLNNKPWWYIPQWFLYSKNKKREEDNLIEFENKKEELVSNFIQLSERISKRYFENERVDKNNEVKFNKKYNEILCKLKESNRDLSSLIKNLNCIKETFSEKDYNLIIDKLISYEDIISDLQNYISAINMFERYSNQIKINGRIADIQRKALIYAQEEDKSINKEDVELIIQFNILQNILELEKNEEVKEAISYINKFDSIVSLTNEKMKLKQELVKKYIIEKCNKEIESLKMEKCFREFKRQAEKKRALWPIRKYIENYSDLVLRVFPCFLLGPETVSDILPLVEGLFDIVIFDEASQMYIEDAIPTIYRAKKAIIAGDDKQLRPSGTFKSTISNEFEEEEEDEDLAALEEESLLDLAKVNYDKIHLMYHYRSRYEQLINFSNYAFYDGRLKISPNLINDYNFKPIERIMCNGRWIDRSNKEEAEKVVDLIYKILKERKNKETLGIITFNINQKAIIENVLELKAMNDSEFSKLYNYEINRVENNEDVSLFVKNIENVQGDERDIIIFSTGYGKNEKGRVSVNFGSLSQEGGENRLNVAISRAKEKIYLITSIEPEELSVDSSKNVGTKLFKKYLQYARAVSNGNKKEQETILYSLVDSNINHNTERIHDSDFEAEVYDMLVEKGYEVYTQVGVSGYRIDMAIYDKEKDQYVLGIECDGATYHSSKSARERDIHRQRYLESRGWNIIRIWSRNWWKDPKTEISRIQKRLKELNY